jgi:hypothetical protein
MVIQTPHSTPIKCTLVMSFNPLTRTTSGIFYSRYRLHQQYFFELLEKSLRHLCHPLLLPILLFRVYNDRMEGYCRLQDNNTHVLEKDTGWTDYYQYQYGMDPERHPESIIKQINGTLYALSRFDQFIDFELRLHDFLSDSGSFEQVFNTVPNSMSEDVSGSRTKFRQWLQHMKNISLNHRQTSASLRTRIQAQNSVVRITFPEPNDLLIKILSGHIAIQLSRPD